MFKKLFLMMVTSLLLVTFGFASQAGATNASWVVSAGCANNHIVFHGSVTNHWTETLDFSVIGSASVFVHVVVAAGATVTLPLEGYGLYAAKAGSYTWGVDNAHFVESGTAAIVTPQQYHVPYVSGQCGAPNTIPTTTTVVSVCAAGETWNAPVGSPGFCGVTASTVPVATSIVVVDDTTTTVAISTGDTITPTSDVPVDTAKPHAAVTYAPKRTTSLPTTGNEPMVLVVLAFALLIVGAVLCKRSAV